MCRTARRDGFTLPVADLHGTIETPVNQDGGVYQKDLGEGTFKVAPTVTAFDPDSTWTEVKERSS